MPGRLAEQAQTELGNTPEWQPTTLDATARSAAAAVGQRSGDALKQRPTAAGGGVDQTARDSAAAAQSEIDTPRGQRTHNTDTTARYNRQAMPGQTELSKRTKPTLETHRNSTA